MLQKIILAGLVAALTFPTVTIAASKKLKVVCVNAAGALTVRPKCKKRESVFRSELLSSRIAEGVSIVGPKGSQGEIGGVGAQGATGSIGEVGVTGPAGKPGVDGVIGVNGPQGPQGAMGPSGPQGVKGIAGTIDFSGCRKVTSGLFINFNQSFMVVPEAVASANCNPNLEFVFSDGFTLAPFGSSAGTKAFIRARTSETNTIVGDTREYLVTYTAERLVAGGQGQYTLKVDMLCCPR